MTAASPSITSATVTVTNARIASSAPTITDATIAIPSASIGHAAIAIAIAIATPVTAANRYTTISAPDTTIAAATPPLSEGFLGQESYQRQRRSTEDEELIHERALVTKARRKSDIGRPDHRPI
jgi:hypothetical protein